MNRNTLLISRQDLNVVFPTLLTEADPIGKKQTVLPTLITVVSLRLRWRE